MRPPRPATRRGGPILEELAADNGGDVGRSYVAELRRPRDEILEVHGRGDLALYEQVMRDDQVYPTFHQRRASVVAREWRVDPGGEGRLDVMAADSLREQLEHVSWDRATYRMLSGLMFGYGVAECMFEPDGLRVCLGEIKVRRTKRFGFGQAGDLRIDRGHGKHEPLPDQKFWTFTANVDDDDNPYGIGLGHYLYWPTWFKRNAVRWWAVFLERFAQPTPVARVPPGTSEPERRKILELIAAVQTGGRIVLPTNVPLELLQAMKDSGGDYERFVNRLDGSIAKIVLTQTMTTDNGASLSQAAVHERKGDAVAKSDSDLLSETFTAGPARWLTAWNFPGAKVPRVYRDFSEAVDLKALADRDMILNQLGWRPTEERMLEVYGEGYERAPAATPAPAPAEFAEARPSPRDASLAVPALLGNWRRVLGPEVDRIEELLADCRSLDEVRERLGDIAKAKPTMLADSLGRMMFAANLAGQADNTGEA